MNRKRTEFGPISTPFLVMPDRYSFWDEDLDGNDLNDGPQGPMLIDYDYEYNEDIYLDIETTVLSEQLYTGEWNHGDVVSKAFYEHLDYPDDTYVWQ